jgi:two-component system, NtrC family, response regulator HydG
MTIQPPSLVAVPQPLDRDGVLPPPLPILGACPAMRQLLELIELVADSDASVLITGESGTGKELVARAIHKSSRRRHEPFVAINCAALPASLLESELFGHVKGAFTDAKRSHDGLFVQAGHGTIFLDEVGEMPLEMQAKLLRAVEQRRVRPVGSDSEAPVDARLVTATNRDLEIEVAARHFRHDLYYRIDVIEVAVPPLRGRMDDILLLARHFAELYSRRLGREAPAIAASAARCLLEYPWPGNVRELENCIQSAVTLSRGPTIERDGFPARIRDHRSTSIPIAMDTPDDLISMDEMQRRYLAKVLALVGGNKTRAAKVLGVDRRTLYRLVERLGLVGGGAPPAG